MDGFSSNPQPRQEAARSKLAASCEAISQRAVTYIERRSQKQATMLTISFLLATAARVDAAQEKPPLLQKRSLGVTQSHFCEPPVHTESRQGSYSTFFLC